MILADSLAARSVFALLVFENLYTAQKPKLRTITQHYHLYLYSGNKQKSIDGLLLKSKAVSKMTNIHVSSWCYIGSISKNIC